MYKGMYRRKDRLIVQKRHDAYQDEVKYTDPTACRHCGSVFTRGYWTWKEKPRCHELGICPACRRVADHYPAGLLEIRGELAKQQRTEIYNLIRNVEKKEKSNRPLERIMAIEKVQAHITLITTTGIHIARRIGEALSRSHQGQLSFQYADGDKTIRVYWEK